MSGKVQAARRIDLFIHEDKFNWAQAMGILITPDMLRYWYSGTCLIRHTFGQEKCVGLPNCRIRRVKMHSKTFVGCREILSDPENSGLYRCRIRQVPLYYQLVSFVKSVSPIMK